MLQIEVKVYEVRIFDAHAVFSADLKIRRPKATLQPGGT